MTVKNTITFQFIRLIALVRYYKFVTGCNGTSTAVEKEIWKIEITATRRAAQCKTRPLNILGMNADVLAEQNIGKLEDIAVGCPG